MSLEQYATLTKTYVEICWKCHKQTVKKAKNEKNVGETWLVLCRKCGG